MLLPQPDGPIMAVILFSGSARLISAMACFVPYQTFKFLISMTVCPGSCDSDLSDLLKANLCLCSTISDRQCAGILSNSRPNSNYMLIDLLDILSYSEKTFLDICRNFNFNFCAEDTFSF